MIRPGGGRLNRSFFARPTRRVARDLIGLLLVHRHRAGLAAGIIVETEAYTGRRDPGSHAYPGLGKRNAPMFGPPGKAYVYKCHMYPLLNVVTEREGTPGAVLLRALEPVAGLAGMRRRRHPRGRGRFDLTSGPGRLCQAMGVGLSFNRADLVRGRLFLARPRSKFRCRIKRSTRIGLKGAAARLPLRFYAAANPWISRHPDDHSSNSTKYKVQSTKSLG